MEQAQIGRTMKNEEETGASSATCTEIDLNHLKQEPGLVQSVKSEPAVLIKREPAVLVKKEIAENSSEDDGEQQCAQATSAPSDAGRLYEANSMRQGDLLNVKQELEDIDIGPTVLQHMDIHYALNKNTVDGCNEAMRRIGGKKSVVDALGDCRSLQNAMTKERIHVLQNLQHTLKEHHLAACSVHVTRMDVFQCDLCHSVYAEKRKLLQHLQAVHACRSFASLIVKFCENNKRTAADNKATLNKSGQVATEVDYDEAHMQFHLGQQKELQKHQLQHHTTSSNSFKCDRTFLKPHLLSSRKAVAAIGTVAGLSNQSGVSKNTRTKQKPSEYEKGFSLKAGLNLHKCSNSNVKLKNHLVNHDTQTRKKHYHNEEKFEQSGDLTKNKNKSKKPLQCEICDASFAQSSTLTQHVRIHTGEKPYQCKNCDASFAQSSTLIRHVRIHTGEKPYMCKMCGARFTQINTLTDHIRIHTGEKPYQCKMCDSRFTRSNGLTRHMEIHTDEKPFYQCKMCDAKFLQISSLTKHLKGHTGEKSHQYDKGDKPYECEKSDAKFVQRGNLTKHMRLYRGEKPFQCENCDASFTQSGTLTRHVRIHTGEKPYQCQMCDARFTRTNGLNDHMRIHTGEKPYQCQMCDARFTRTNGLNDHMRIHTGEKPYQCKMCDFMFRQKGGLTQHLKLHTGEKRYQCKICNARFAHSGGLIQHTRIHTGEKPYKCEKCDKMFAFHSSFAFHMRNHSGEKSYRYDKAEKPYVCEKCDAKFAQMGNLTKHMRLHTSEKL